MSTTRQDDTVESVDVVETSTQSSTSASTRISVVARKELRHVSRSRSAQTLLVVLLVSVIGVFQAVARGLGPTSATAAVDNLGLPFQLLVPLAAILVGCFTVSGERASGSLRVLLGMPLSRTEIVVGKLVGGLAALAVGVAAAIGFAILVSLGTFGTVPVRPLVGLGVTTVLFAFAFGGLSIGVSAAAATPKRSIAVVTGGYMTMTFLWEPVVVGIHRAASQVLPSSAVATWVPFLERLNPIEAYADVATILGGASVYPLRITFGLLERDSGASLADHVSGVVAGYLVEPFLIGVLCAWTMVPVLFGMVRLRAVDIS
ncbi:ABC-2 type transport system permease protein [Halorubrum alkaliphilum]|uniref:ABC-2 type transport system permease protein n=1 Tax=Halorubrum alkaliphilum TaxID=261290 RepID=A0A8T4GBZ1_9EURY|nr:ABC transporter permease subunit [Halorubrum alkaliphilum]MBP1921948.1 ABC-2 type transport system permease protein [Halorubrum alkaliphilum]